MPIVKCPSCPAKYDPGVDDNIKDIPVELSMKVVCPNCGQWLRLPEQEKVDPPNVPEEVLREMRSQSRLVELVQQPAAKPRRDDEYEEEERPRSSRRRDEDEDRPRRSRRDEEDDDYDRPRRSRRDDDDDDYGRSSSHRGYDDARDDYDDLPPRRRSRAKPGDGLAITSMIVGISAVVLCLVGSCFGFCCIFGYPGNAISFIMGALAVVLGFISRSQGSQSGMGTAGIITGFAAILLSVIMIVLLMLGVAWMQANQGNFGPGPGGGGAGGNPRKF